MTQDLMLIIDPATHHLENDAIFEMPLDPTGADIQSRWIYLRQWFEDRGVKVHTADRYLRGEVRSNRYAYISLGLANHYKALAQRPNVVLSAFFAFESPIVEPRQYYTKLHVLQKYFKRIFTFTDIAAFAPFLRGPVQSQLFHLPYPHNSIKPEHWSRNHRKFLVMINHNKLPGVRWNELYTERMRAVQFFAKYNEIDLYGLGWDGPPFDMSQAWLPGAVQKMRRSFLKQWQRVRPVPLLEAARTVYRGAAPSKFEALAQYDFAICFENVEITGWVTEKIFDCFVAGAIPVYWGAPDIESFVPAECFIDMRRFSGYEELRRYLKSLRQHDIQRFRECAREYLGSDQFRPFTKEHFTDLVASIIDEDTGVLSARGRRVVAVPAGMASR